MNYLLLPFKYIQVFLVIITYSLMIFIIRLLPLPWKIKLFLISIAVHINGIWLVIIFSISITIKNKDKLNYKDSYLIVSNHMSYIDIPVIASIFKSLFITSLDLQDYPLLNFIARLGGSVFVNRRSKLTLKKDIKNINRILRANINLVLFPEGTSSDGSKVIPFKSSLLESSISQQKTILPVCITYTDINNKKFDSVNRDKLCWYGDMTFFSHFINMLLIKKIKAQVFILDPLFVKKTDTRKEISDKLYSSISELYLNNIKI